MTKMWEPVMNEMSKAIVSEIVGGFGTLSTAQAIYPLGERWNFLPLLAVSWHMDLIVLYKMICKLLVSVVVRSMELREKDSYDEVYF